jgi:hypothetical protein
VSTLRRHRLLTVLVALASLLFMQLAVAGYACPGQGAGVSQVNAQDTGATSDARMPCAESMGLPEAVAIDVHQPALCHAHCQDSPQMTDGHTLQLPAAMAGAVVAYLSVPRDSPPVAGAPQAPLLARATPPPLSIRHCCFRI